jgi:exosome complex RNA-binding protein Rrp42 (RNase PH superfamily)
LKHIAARFIELKKSPINWATEHSYEIYVELSPLFYEKKEADERTHLPRSVVRRKLTHRLKIDIQRQI